MQHSDWEQAAALWGELQARSPGSFFTSWSWIGSWLACLPADCRAHLLTARDAGGRVVGLGVIVLRRRWRAGLPVRTAWLHETGLADVDAITIEYNGWRVVREGADAIRHQMLAALLNGPLPVDELRLSGVARVPDSTGEAWFVRAQAHRSYQVGLQAIRDAGGDYLAVLRQHPRYLVRKSLKRLESSAPLSLRVAGSLEEAIACQGRLVELHTRYWRSRGQAGAYASAFQQRFHERLLRVGFGRGEVRLLTVMHGDAVLGCLQYFCFDGWVHYYQSGIDYGRYALADSPGLAAHALAIDHFQRTGWQVYDFMTGDYQYKRTLATGHAELHWVAVARDSLRMRVVDTLRRQGRRLRDQLRGAGAPPVAAAPAPSLPVTAPAPLGLSAPRTPRRSR